MEKSEIKKEFASLYGIVALNKQVEDMKLFGSVMCEMMDVLVESHPNTAEKFLEKLESGRTRQTLWGAMQMLTQNCCQTIHEEWYVHDSFYMCAEAFDL